MDSWVDHHTALRKGLIKLLEIKDSDIRLLTLAQARDAVDKGVHIGGAFSAVIPMVAIYYAGFIRFNIAEPTRPGEDLFVLSKGHAVASMASIYADLGYFDHSVLKNSRSVESILNGHPGPLLPGVHVSTGPLGQGLSVSEGFALAGRRSPKHDVFCLAGDGELQEGLPWEAVMYSAHTRLDNLCLIVDANNGQLDNPRQLIFPMVDLDRKFAAFGWRVYDLDGSQYAPIVEALSEFKHAPRDGRPTVIISRTRKGFGGYSSFMVNHKVVMSDLPAKQEMEAQTALRTARETEFLSFWSSLAKLEERGAEVQRELASIAKEMNLEIIHHHDGPAGVRAITTEIKIRQAALRDKKIHYDASRLPILDSSKEYSSSSIVTQAMKVFAQDRRVVSVDADLSSTSGLEEGVSWADTERGLNVGVAEANMMAIGEAYAALGYNVWVSTFCPFFDWKVLRRIAIGQQERLETIARGDGWLNEGHGLDLTFLATAPNLETKTNGATHMGNDDILIFSEMAHLKIIDISCPNQLLAVMRWVMEGNRGLIYTRIMRSPSRVLYPNDYTFEYGKSYTLTESPKERAVIVSSGRGVHEALAASKILSEAGVPVGVVDMPSIDREKLLELYDSKKLVVIAEQNNGYIWSQLRKILFDTFKEVDNRNLLPSNTLGPDRQPVFIHSATYEQLLQRFGLTPGQIAETVRRRLG